VEKIKIFLVLAVAFAFIAGCAQPKDFGYGLKLIHSLNSKYNATMESYPRNIPQINSMVNELAELKKLALEKGQEPFEYAIEYRVLNLEAEKSYIEGQKYGATGTTKQGFGCKSRPLILESVSFRNNSALKGFESIDLLREFIGKYPKEAAMAGLSEKNALFLNATFYQIQADARRDSNIINNFCPKNVTLELYQEEFRKKTNYSEDFISNISYEEAVQVWKKLRRIG